jgi:hypothetical protein
VAQVERQLRVVVVGPVVLGEGHERAGGAVVEQGVDVEGREHARAVGGHEVLAGQALGGAGVDEAVEGLDEDDVLEGREVGGEVVQLARVACHAGLLCSWCVLGERWHARACSAGRPAWSG